MEKNGCQKSLDQSRKDYTAPGPSTFHGSCRLCLKGNCHLQKLFPGGYTEDVLISKIFECTTVEITFETDPDALICYSCVAKIEEFHRYREQCRSNDVQHKNSLQRAAGGQIHTATTSTLLPAKYIKKEIDSEGFEISAADFFPIDTDQPSYSAFETSLDAPIASVADSSGAVVDSTIPNENGVLNESDEDDDNNENLLELMPERTHDGFTISYTNVNDEYDDNNEVVCELPIKEEPQDFDGDDTAGPWNDYGMDDDGSMDHHNSTSLVPLLEDCSYSSDSEPELEVEQHPYREVYSDTGLLVCIMQDGFLYVRKSKCLWKCRMKNCTAEVIRYADRKELQSNGMDHVHAREVRSTATDEEILRLVEHASSDDENFHYVTNVRHGSSIVYKGYKYSMKHIKLDGTTYWKCRSYNGSCSAALYQSPNNEFTTVGTHTHAKQVADGAPKTVQPAYVTSVSTEGEGSPPKIKLRIARQTDAAATKVQTSETDAKECKQISPYKSPLKVFKRGYGHKIVKNSNGRTRLSFDGNLYVRESARKDESGAVVVLWRCRRNYDMCGVKALQHEDGLVEVLGEHDHSSIKNTLEIPKNVTGTTAYEMLSTPKGGETMLLDGYRFVQAYCRPNGISLWRCVGAGGVFCRAKVTLAKDGMAYVDRNETHSHGKPRHVKNLIPKMVETSITRTRAIKANEGEEKKMDRTAAGSGGGTTISKPDKTLGKAVPVSPAAATVTVAPSQTMKVMSKSQPVRNYRVIRNKKGNRALVHAGYRYCRIRTRQDGSVSWLCKINKKTCRVPVYEHPDGRLEWTSHRRHNHGPTDPIDPPKKQLPPQPSPSLTSAPRVKRTAYHIDDDTFVNNEWFFVRNHKNGTTLIHAGHRYHKKGKRVNATSLWRCAQACNGCRAAIVLHPDETIAKFDDIDHSHPPPNTAIKDMEVIVGDPDESVEQNNSTSNRGNDTEPDLSLVHFNGCIEEQDDPEANMRSLLNTMLLDVSDDAANKSTDKVVVPAAQAHYKYVTNRRHTKSLVFRGYRYARAGVGVRADGSVRWMCQMNKKTCRVSVRILKDGSVEIDDQKHNHAQLPEDRETHDGGVYDDDNDDDDDEGDEQNDTNASVCNDDTNPEDESDDNEEEEQEPFYFALNRSNGKSLIYQRNRYSRENVRPDGSTVWRCMVRSDCMAKVVLLLNKKCIPYRDTAHNHPPLDVLPKPLHYPEQRAKLNVKGDMLIYKQNRMKKTKSFSDGTALFKCTEVEGCKGIVKIRYEETEHGSSSPVVVFDRVHNHPSGLTDAGSTSGSGIKPAGGKSKRKSPVKMLKYSPNDDADNGKEYQLFKNDRGQVSLVYKGYRFSLRNLNAKGDSSWKCRSNRLCIAYVTFTKDGLVIPNAGKGEPKVMPHNHPINGEYIGRAVPLKLDELHPPANNLGKFVSNWLDGMYKTELGWKAKTSLKSPKSLKTTTMHRNNNEQHNTIYHKSYSYKLQTTKNGREFWRCTMFKARACRAGLFCTNNGTIIQYENGRQHNHEPTAKPLPASSGQQSIGPRKSFPSGGVAKAKANDGTNSPLSEAQKSIKRSQSALPFDEQSADGTVTPAPSYQIIKRDGIDTLYYERHRYSVSFSKRDEATNGKEPKRWRCCLWNSRHQCPVELTISPTDEIHFVTDPTHNHRPPPPELQESLDRQAVVSSATKGTKKYELMGRFQKTVFYKGHKFSWKEERNGTAYYRCLCHSSHDCAVSVKIDVNGLLYECSPASHNHSPALDTSTDSVTLSRKPMTERNIISRQTRLEQCSKTGSTDYRFVRSCLGNSMIFEGHRYWLHSKLSCGLNVYRCRYQKQKDCSGSVYMDADTRLMYHRYDAEHSHEPLAEDAVAGIEQDTTNASMNVSELNDSSAHDDNIDEQDLDNTNSSSNNNLPTAAIVPKKEVIITNDYSFMKDSLNKNQLFYEQYVFEMVPLRYRKNGDKFYSCLFADCPAAVKLLASGGLDISNPIHHEHERPDLTDYRDIGRGSSDFLTLSSSTAPGTIPMIRFEGYQYCASAVSQLLPDDTKLFHCQEKNRATGRCSATLEMLPNGRVFATGTHQHPKPNQTETEDSKETSQSNILILGGRSYAYLETQRDGTGVWQCTDDPKCMAQVYKKPDGKLVFGTIKHVLRHLMPKLPNHSASSLVTKSAVPTTATATASLNNVITTSLTVPRSVSTGNLRTKWYKGNRYNFYLTRRDGVQYWRCCKRMEDKCEAGIFCYPSGKITPSNQWPHSHPPLNPSASSLEPEVQETKEYKVQQLAQDDHKPDAKGTTNHSLRISPDTSDVFVWYKGVQYSLRHRHTDGIRIYRCRNKPCAHSLVVTKHGKIISKKNTWHSCESQTSSEDNKCRDLVPWTNSASGLGFDKPEIEDPDDLDDDHNDGADIQPTVKRIRLDSSNTGIDADKNCEPESEAMLQTVDRLPNNLDAETEVEQEVEPIEESHGGLLPTGDFMDGNGATSSTWDEPQYIVHEFESIDATDDDNGFEGEDRPMDDDGTHNQEEAFEALAASESIGEGLMCLDASNL